MSLLSHEVRRSIVCLLRDGELTPSDLSLRLDRRAAGVSFHLEALLAAGLIRFRASRSKRFYRLYEPSVLLAWDVYAAELETRKGVNA